MAFSPWTLFGQSVGSGLSQGYQDQTRFNNILSRANRLYDFGQQQNGGADKLNLALSLMGGGKSSGNPLDAIIAAVVAQQFGLNQPGGMPTQSSPTQNPIGPKTNDQLQNLKSQLRQGEILVQDKQGNFIALPSNEFDPKVYERVP